MTAPDRWGWRWVTAYRGRGDDARPPLTRHGLREAAEDVVRNAQPDDDFDGQYIDMLVESSLIDALRAALATPAPLSPEPFPPALPPPDLRLIGTEYKPLVEPRKPSSPDTGREG